MLMSAVACAVQALAAPALNIPTARVSAKANLRIPENLSNLSMAHTRDVTPWTTSKERKSWQQDGGCACHEHD
jgi:hypothetical protein